jgi:hypothetical protein
MSKIKVYQVKIYDVTSDEWRVSRRWATKKGAAIMRGEIVPQTGLEIEASCLQPGEEWTPRDFGVESDELIPGRREARARVMAAGLSDDDIDRLIKQAQHEVEPPVG